MRRLCLLLYVILLLGGCAAPAASPDVTASPAPTQTVAPTAVPTPTPTATPFPTPVPTPDPVSVTLYVPADDGEHLAAVEGVCYGDTPLAILDALVQIEALPDVDFGRNVYFTVGESFVKRSNKVYVPRVVARLDVSDAFLRALEQMTPEQEVLTLQSMANTFITHYDAESFMLTVAGDKLETRVRDYEKGISFDQYAKTLA